MAAKAVAHAAIAAVPLARDPKREFKSTWAFFFGKKFGLGLNIIGIGLL